MKSYGVKKIFSKPVEVGIFFIDFEEKSKQCLYFICPVKTNVTNFRDLKLNKKSECSLK